MNPGFQRNLFWSSQLLGLLLTFKLFGAGVTNFHSEIAYRPISSLGIISDGRYLSSRLVGDGTGVFFGTTSRGGSRGFGTVFRMNQDGSGFEVLHHFQGTSQDGQRPYADLVLDPDGFLYGTTELGGSGGSGTVFKLHPDGSDYEIIFNFDPNRATGINPRGHLERGSDGTFFSTTQAGGTGQGVVYTIKSDGSGFRVLYSFQPSDGQDPDAGLTLASDGVLYGTCSIDSMGTGGSVFKINQDGSGFRILHTFVLPFGDGTQPKGRLLELSDGALYGVTLTSIYRINKNGSGFSVLTDQGFWSGLVQGTDGALFAASAEGAVFRIQPNGSDFAMLHSFDVRPTAEDTVTGGVSFGGITRGTNGALLGVANDSIFRIQEDGTDPVVLHQMEHIAYTPKLPASGLLRASDGRFYGTSEAGGFSNAGTIFVLNANGSEYRPIFQFGRGTNTASVPNGLIEASDGFLYGTTQSGGVSSNGVVFKLAKEGTNYGILKSFGTGNEPRLSLGRLLEGSDGWLYGLSFLGGTNGRGTVFKLQKDGSAFAVIRNLGGGLEPHSPVADLVQPSNGFLFGTAPAGGAANLGAIFRLRPDGSDYARVHDFAGNLDGQRPQAGLVLDSEGNLFGTSTGAGTYAGTVFRLDADGNNYQVLYRFPASGSGGKTPKAPLLDGGDGFLYGTTTVGGTKGKGTIFRLRKDGQEFSTIWDFGAIPFDGEIASSGLTAVGDGSYLGVTETGGEYGNGEVFRFDPVTVRLTILNLSAIQISWPASSTTDRLEHTINLSAPTWEPVSTETIREGALLKSVPPSNTSDFFRLRRDWP